MSPQDLVTYGAGVMALAYFFWFLRGVLNAYAKKLEKNTDGEISLAQALQAQLTSSYERNKTLTDRYDEAMQKALQMSIAHGQEMLAAVNDVRREYHEGMIRVHGILEQTKIELAECQNRHEECDANVARLEARIDGMISGQH